MNIRWSPEAATDFSGIVEYIRTQNPSAADRIARTIVVYRINPQILGDRASAARFTALALKPRRPGGNRP